LQKSKGKSRGRAARAACPRLLPFAFLFLAFAYGLPVAWLTTRELTTRPA
jgi:hypothetical protein